MLDPYAVDAIRQRNCRRITHKLCRELHTMMREVRYLMYVTLMYVIGPETFSETQGVAGVKRRVVTQVGVNELLELKLCMGPGYTPWANILQKHSCRSRICDCRSCPCECSRDRVFRRASPLPHRLFITVFCCSVGTNVATTVDTNGSAFSC